MNIKLLVSASFLIAFLGHIVFFNLVTFVFPIKPEPIKPKFFFLGPILTQKDIARNVKKDGQSIDQIDKTDGPSPNAELPRVDQDEASRSDNPFAIKSISKPLADQPDHSNDKINPKSMFESGADQIKAGGTDADSPAALDLNIQPYRPMQIKSD